MNEFYGPEESEAYQESAEKARREGKTPEPMSEGESDALRKKMEALDQFLGKSLKARFKIEVQFGKERSTWKPCAGAMTIYLSGTKLHGGGDEKLYFCPRDDCEGIVPPISRFVKETADGQAIAHVPCPTCGMMWPESDLVGELFFRLTPQDWAHVILRCFIRLEHNADIYVKYHPTDIRYQTKMEMARQRGGEEVYKARKNRGLHIYPLKNIIKDTSNGADLYKRILAFITA